MDGQIDQDADFEADLDRSLSLMSTPKKWPPLCHRMDGHNIMYLAGATTYPDLPAHRKILFLVLLLAVRDRASGLRFEPWRFEKGQGDNNKEGLGLRMFYEVDGAEHELVPPPSCLRRWIPRDIESLGNLNRPLQRIGGMLRRVACLLDGQDLPTRTGAFRLRLGELEIEVSVWVYASALGSRYLLKFESCPEAASASANDEFRRIGRVAQYRPYPDLCPDLL